MILRWWIQIDLSLLSASLETTAAASSGADSAGGKGAFSFCGELLRRGWSSSDWSESSSPMTKAPGGCSSSSLFSSSTCTF